MFIKMVLLLPARRALDISLYVIEFAICKKAPEFLPGLSELE